MKEINSYAQEGEKEAIDNYFECVTFCAVEEQENDCKIICMERHLKPNYF